MMPNADDMEKTAIVTMILDPGTTAPFLNQISIDDFYSGQLRKTLLAIHDLHSRGVTIDLISVSEELRKMGFDDPAVFLSVLSDHPVSVNIKNTCEKIKEAATRRRLIEFGNKIIQQAQGDELLTVINTASSGLLNINKQTNPIHVTEISEMAQEAIDRYEELQKCGIVGVPTGLVDVDKYLGGFRPGDLSILAGRTSMGKTSLATQIVLNAATKGFKCLVFSLEMSKEQVCDRFTSQATGVELYKLRGGRLTQEDWRGIMSFHERETGLNIKICDRAMAMTEIVGQARMQCKIGKVDFIVIDYMQLARGVGRDRYHEVTEISRDLKSLAVDLNVPVLALAQLNRQCESRGKDRRPMLSDLRDSGSIEQDADSVMFVYRDHYYDKNANQFEAEVIIAKNRNGKTGVVTVAWNPETTSFRNAYKGAA